MKPDIDRELQRIVESLKAYVDLEENQPHGLSIIPEDVPAVRQ